MSLKPWRVVEAQHILNARDLVDNIEEHEILEHLLENSKPNIQYEKNYLIYTPFRYPPLEYGSRFGQRFEPSLWYGSLELKTALAEVAYYLKKFHLDTTAQLSYIETIHTAFKVYVQTDMGIDLTRPPFHQYQDKISHPSDYQISQRLGFCMRADGVKAFTFTSARCKEKLKNFAAFNSSVFKAIKQQYVFNQQNWQCIANTHQVEFSRMDLIKKQAYRF
jgi:hypothetical protein